MSYLVASGQQAKWKDSCASSKKTNLTLIANGENIPQLYTLTRALVQAGFDAPTIAPTVSDGGGGSLPAGYCAYRYVYASSQYPGAEAILTAGGLLYPKSNPSPASAVFHITVSHQNDVLVTKSERSDVDTIFIYRTAIKSTSADAQALADAGELFYVGFVEDNSVPGTTLFVDNVPTDAGEQLELDNYVAPQFWLTVYDGTFWWGWGNPPLIVEVTLDGATSATVADPTFYSGRTNQLVTFDGITSGGFDGNGTFYFRYFTSTVAQVALTQNGAAATIPASGTTTMRVNGFSSTLYRSKPNNPFGWGITNYFSDGTGGFTREPELYALNIGGGSGSAIAIMQEEALLKLDCENPNGCYVLNLRLGGQDEVTFGQSKRKLDGQYTVASHHAQFYVTFPDGTTNLAGIDAANTAIIVANTASQNRFGSEVVNTVNEMATTNDDPRHFHGVYDPNTELALFWFKTAIDTDLLAIDTCLCYHAPTGQWSLNRDLDVTANCAIFDPVALQTFILIGTQSGQVSRALVPEVFTNLSLTGPLTFTANISDPRNEQVTISFSGLASDPGPTPGNYFDIGDTNGVVRVWFSGVLIVPTPDPPAIGRLLNVVLGFSPTISDTATAIGNALQADTAFDSVAINPTSVDYRVHLQGPTSPPNAGTIDISTDFIVEAVGGPTLVPIDPQPALAQEPGTWILMVEEGTENVRWTVGNAGGYFDFAVTYDPATRLATNGPPVFSGDTTCYMGLINVQARTYYQPDQTHAGQVQEYWSEMRNTESSAYSDGSRAALSMYYRFYQEFDETFTGDQIVPSQDIQQVTNALSWNWVARNWPSPLSNQFGIQIFERGYEGFEVLGLNIKRPGTK